LLLRCFVAAGGFGLSQAIRVKEIGVVEFFAFAAEELTVEPCDLRFELGDVFAQFQDGFLIFGQFVGHAKGRAFCVPSVRKN